MLSVSQEIFSPILTFALWAIPAKAQIWHPLLRRGKVPRRPRTVAFCLRYTRGCEA